MFDWTRKRVAVLGGASFIGSHLVDALVKRGATVRIVDDLSSGKLENIEQHAGTRGISFWKTDLREPGKARLAIDDRDIVFHLAASHGGRGYVDTHQAAPAENLYLDGLIFRECLRAGVGKVVYASSGCVYPNRLQGDPDEILYLMESMVGPPYDADNMYGWAKLLGEMVLKSYHDDWGMKSVSLRYFTVYGRRSVENHAVTAFIARAFTGQDPFEVWGDGSQVRNWTHVSDIVEGTILAAERVDDGTAINLGTMERVRVIDAVKEVIRYVNERWGPYDPRIRFLPEMPTGPLNRVADNSLAFKLLGWEPKVSFFTGLHDTIDWYFETKDRTRVKALLEGDALLER